MSLLFFNFYLLQTKLNPWCVIVKNPEKELLKIAEMQKNSLRYSERQKWVAIASDKSGKNSEQIDVLYHTWSKLIFKPNERALCKINSCNYILILISQGIAYQIFINLSLALLFNNLCTRSRASRPTKDSPAVLNYNLELGMPMFFPSK